MHAILAAVPLAVAAVAAGPAIADPPVEPDWPAEVRQALELAGDNRGELERVLRHYRDLGDLRKLDAAVFLIGNMDGHGYALHAFFDPDGNEVAFDALEHENYARARAAFEKLEAEHGELNYASKSFTKDLETITADYLIENIDLAFQAWREKPWASEIPFDVFCEYILPYRGSNEPLDDWRQTCLDRFADLTGRLQDPESLDEAGSAVLRKSRGWVGFSTLYYLHPTDQGFDEMLETRRGRCEDMSNMMGYACRANAVIVAQDYTPYWANRDNNHAWEVRLDRAGQGRAGLSNRAAKVYRKTYSRQPAALGSLKRDDEQVPRWLSRKTYLDVTADYQPTTDVTVRLTEPAPGGARFAYLCVFNGGDWRAIHYGRIESGTDAALPRATFTAMGRNIAYLPAYFIDEQLVPTAPPFVLARDGSVRVLDGSDDTVAFTVKGRKMQVDGPSVKVKPGPEYELFAWDGAWQSVGVHRVKKDAPPVTYENIPAGRLYWLVASNSRKLERIFTIEEGKRRGW